MIAARIAKEAGTMVILDVGGRDEPFTEELFRYVDILSPNETELIRVLGKKPNDQEEQDHEIELFLRKYPHMKLLLKKGGVRLCPLLLGGSSRTSDYSDKAYH